MRQTHRILIGVIACGAVTIAGIGFAGSYAAVRELALREGFGNFAYVFPIGIDAGICVLLALDLLLTWIRIPFPLLRQTAWLLTAATIAFNGAAAWPDPLGVGMHAVIPILFVVSVEAARHAIGRIADITADKHMEGVRLTRWLLSPVPTFLLWRRMKLWELRSYEQVIKLEQERLVYQARLRSRFGRAWRRKAPVQSLMPLRLARYGVPLAETAPSGLAAAGIQDRTTPAVGQGAFDAPSEATAAPGVQHVSRLQPDAERVLTAPTPRPAPAKKQRSGHAHTAVPQDGPDPLADMNIASEKSTGLTTVDRYYLAWTELHSEHNDETLASTRMAEQLSAHLAMKGLHGRGGKPVSPATLRRYLLPFRIYHLWARQRQSSETPSLETIARECAARDITAQYNKPITTDHITELVTDFERRWQALQG
ncbi:DUF2637 domain-containing protein [Streptomyces sp. NBC_00201]|uniref:DUF2637 domain-containing protein n=1 Tax=unclassified Streptomyces TaxID=2593676 RepID=UPI00225B4226|nr:MULTISPECIES: DUF2637 domain-containing protein [unclassified Streptomyces]MCX5251961.1 DUF2637 domain-containing protein [Streptomyces sp. NBC_00201]